MFMKYSSKKYMVQGYVLLNQLSGKINIILSINATNKKKTNTINKKLFKTETLRTVVPDIYMPISMW